MERIKPGTPETATSHMRAVTNHINKIVQQKMTTQEIEKLTLQWRQDLLNLKERKKQKMFNADRILTIAEKIKTDYKDNFVKPTPDIQNAHIQLCDTLDQANKILDVYRADSIPFTTTTFNILISLAGDLSTATSYFTTLLDLGLKPNTYTLNSFIPYCLTVEQGREVIKSMGKHHVRPNTQTYNALLSITTNENDRTVIFKAMGDQNIEINIVTFNTLISRSSDYRTAMIYYSELKTRKITPTINTFVTLLKKTDRQHEIKELEQILINENIRPNNSWENQLRRKKYGW